MVHSKISLDGKSGNSGMHSGMSGTECAFSFSFFLEAFHHAARRFSRLSLSRNNPPALSLTVARDRSWKCSSFGGFQMETKTRTALPRPRNNAFAQGSPLVRPGNLHLLSELPADLPTKLFAKANRVRLDPRHPAAQLRSPR
jgi:hypothetical protein